eukprot:TRINITY_DN33804_c0_g1_i1.p1 TRINITY_DN33804_c0_g1~~TRINITY_DN33804_c0_g1_i1.p1  ORF type:complete len:300 (+),score=94.35 TRINITY_DN33804_c0_g1_i1:172-1071(+)
MALASGMYTATAALLLTAGQAVRSNVASNELAHGADFACPDECVECCDDSWFNSKKFKCVLKDEAVVPAGRECGKVKTRSSNKSQKKTNCKYLEDEERAPGQCSSSFTCCCDVPGSHPEQPPDELCANQPARGSTMMTHNGFVYEVMDSEQSPTREENHGECVTVDKDKAKMYQTSVLPPTDKPPHFWMYRLDSCCLKAEYEVVHHKWVKRSMKNNTVGGWKAVAEWTSEDKSYLVCKEFEVLPKCSDPADRGKQGKQRHFKKVGPAGFCAGDKQLNGYDANMHVCDDSCVCTDECGSD